MSDPVSPIPEPSIPPEARVGRAYIDAVSDGVQNCIAMAIVAYFWNKGELDKYVALGALAVILGFLNAGQVIDRFTANRAPRAPLTALLGLMGGKAMGMAGAAEVARRTFLGLALVALPSALTLQACAHIRAANDIAKELCEATMGAEAARTGITVEELCILPHVISPFLAASKMATSAHRTAVPPMGEP